MELNKIMHVLGAIAAENLVPGRGVVLTSHIHEIDYGSQSDVPGAKYPADSTEASGNTVYVVGWTVPLHKGPFFQGVPGFDEWSLRDGFDKGENLPLGGSTSFYMHLTWPGHKSTTMTIPSGSMVRLFYGAGTIVTIPSGEYIYNSALDTPGDRLEVLNATDDGADKGKFA